MALISAPAGYGKSVLASQWLEVCTCPGAWLSLDENDNDLRVFLTYLIESVQDAFPGVALKTRTLLKAASLPSLKVLAYNLLNDMEQVEEPFILVLDDYHRIREKAVHSLLIELLRYPSPMLHLVLLTRRDPPLPIGPLRAGGQLTEITIEHLRFTNSETTAFLARFLSASPDESTASVLNEKVEGWVTGLRLAALSMGQKGERDHILEGLGEGAYFVREYLMQEVLLKVPGNFASFLIETSILNRFCAPLCDAVQLPEERPVENEKNGQAFIEWLEKTHLFVVPLDETHTWFRYHHLFQQLLQDRLKRKCSPEEIGTFHSRASRWFEENGLIQEALDHAIQAGDVHGAAGIVEKNRHAALNDDKWFTVEKWLAYIPDENIRQSPELLLTRAWVLNHRFQLLEIPEILEHVDSILQNDPSKRALTGEFYFFKALLSFWQGQLDSTIAYSEKSQEQVPKEPEYGLIRGDNEIYHAIACQMIGKKEIAIRELDQKISSHPKRKGIYYSRLLAVPCFVHMLSGDLRQVETAAALLRRVSEKHGFSYANTWSDYMQACCSFHACDLDEAIQHFAAAADQKYIMHSIQALNCLAGLAFSYQMTGQREKADETIKQLIAFAHETDDAARHSIAQSARIRLSLLQGNAEAGSESIGSIDEEPGMGSFFLWLELPHVTHCRQLVLIDSDESLEEAAERLDALREAAGAIHNTFHLIDILVLKALAFYKRSRREEALKILEQALNLATPGGWVRPFVEPGSPMPDMLTRLKKQNGAGDYIEKILAAFGDEGDVHTGEAPMKDPDASAHRPARPSTPIQPLVEPLTQRELDVLELLSTRLQNKEIALELSISPLTVKSHLQSIYQKLCVENRRQAVEKSRELGILGI